MNPGNENSPVLNDGAAVEHGIPQGRSDGRKNPAAEAGWFLRREREAHGLSLEDASHQVGIHGYHLSAIEAGDLTRMPKRAEALEMIAAYADFLGFEPEPLVRHYLTFLPKPEVAPRRHPAAPAPMSSAKVLTFGKFVKLPPLNLRLPTLPNGSGVVASFGAAMIVASALAWTMLPGSSPDEASGQVAKLEAADPMPTASTDRNTDTVKITEEPILETATSSAQAPEGNQVLDPDVMGAFIQKNVDDQAAAEEPQNVNQAQQQIASLDTKNGRVFGETGAPVRLVLKANRPIWLLIEDDKGNRVATQLLNKGDTYRVPDRKGLVATVQDGGAISYVIDGVERGTLGQPGSVLAAEPLDLGALEAKG